jgi:hypothetical protein
MDPLDVVRHLVGMQAQLPLNLYVGLWSHLDDCAPAAIDEVGRLLTETKLVRIVVMRSAIHLVSAAELFFAIRIMLALVHVPPRGIWGQGMQVTVANLDDGFLIAASQIRHDPTIGRSTLSVRHADRMPAAQANDITAEGSRTAGPDVARICDPRGAIGTG